MTKFNINEDSISSVLTFNAARPSDAGQYICEAVNDHGQHTKIYNLIVLGKMILLLISKLFLFLSFQTNFFSFSFFYFLIGGRMLKTRRTLADFFV